jgi:WD domain, G-beta repeat
VVAYCHGSGMPASVIARLAPLFRTDAPSIGLTTTEFDRVLQRIRFYLRSSPDTDGTTLYRLFHQGLADHLRTGTANLSALLDRLLATATLDSGGQRQWDAAEPYVRRHATRHAVDAGRLDQLIRVDPKDLEPLFNTTATPQGRLAAAIYRNSLQENHAADLVGGRDFLALNAVRFAAPDLAEWLADLPDLPVPQWWPRWSVGVQIYAPHHAVMTGHDGAVYSVACTTLDGRPVAVTGGDDGTVRVWDLTTSQPYGGPLTSHDSEVLAAAFAFDLEVFTVACATLDSGPAVVTGGASGVIRVWDLATGQPAANR